MLDRISYQRRIKINVKSTFIKFLLNLHTELCLTMNDTNKFYNFIDGLINAMINH
jgi:hypothetical protein